MNHNLTIKTLTGLKAVWITALLALALLAAAAALDPEATAAAAAETGRHHSESGASGGAAAGHMLLYAVRAVYYIALMAAAGMALWSVALPFERSGEPMRLHAKWSLLAVRTMLLVSIVYIFVHFNALMQGLGDEADALVVFVDTTAGRSWIALLALSLIGFAVQKLDEAFRAIWALLLLAAESFGGHTLALDKPVLSTVTDFLHLICSAIWAGGVMLLLFYWYSDRKEAGRFAARFTSVAWIAIVLLVVTGLLMTVSILPSWRYLLYSNWGWLLLAKTVLALAVVIVGAFLRLRAGRKEMPPGALLKLDGTLMASVLLIVGVLTYIGPAPDTEPLHYHKMGETLHYTLEISPNGPGPNDVSLKVWLPKELGEPESVELAIRPADRPEAKPIDVSLSPADGEGDNSFPGFTLAEYRDGKTELPYPGRWRAELVITDSEGNVTAESIDFRND